MKALVIIPIPNGFVLMEQEVLETDCVPIKQLQAVVSDTYSHYLTDAVTAWRAKSMAANPPPETS